MSKARKASGSASKTMNNIRLVLVRPRGPINIGSVARAMKNVGLRELVLVNPATSPLHPDALLMAVRSREILENVLIFSHLADAIANCTWVVGTTRRIGRAREGIIEPRELCAEIMETALQNRIAIVFGPEDRGLSNRDLDLCQRLVTIPVDEQFGSLNLAQAVMIICYEIYLAVARQGHLMTTPRLATSKELERMYRHMEDVLLQIDFLKKNNPKRMMAVLRKIFGKARLNSREVRILRGICRQANWHGGQQLNK